MSTTNYNEMVETTARKRLLTIKEAAKLIDGITEYRVRQMCKSGHLRCFKAGNKYLIYEKNLNELVFGTE